MRTTFTIELKVYVPTDDGKRREAFIDGVIKTCRRLKTQASMLSPHIAPDFSMVIEDTEGRQVINLFEDGSTTDS